MCQTAPTILEHYAAFAGLSRDLVGFATKGDLAHRLSANPFLMAPMAGVSNSAWRIMARAAGAALAYSEMVSVAGLHFGANKTWELAEPQAPEPDLAVQLFGSKPEQFYEAAQKLVARLERRLVLIDINMACPVPKVMRKGEGAALMEEPLRAGQIVDACKRGVQEACGQIGAQRIAVTCKIRRGIADSELAPDFAEQLEAAGADAIAVHGRFACQLYRGKADWGTISRVASRVTIPTIASGDILSADDALRVLQQTGATAAMVARGSYGNPWIFSDARQLLAHHTPEAHDVRQRLSAMACHVRLLDVTGAHMVRARSLAGWYLKGLPDAARWRNLAMACSRLQDFLGLIDQIERELI